MVYRVISIDMIKRAGFTVASGAKTSTVTLIQPFGSALNLNIHLHMLLLDGVYTFEDKQPQFNRAQPPTNAKLTKLLQTISRRLARLPERQGLLIRDCEDPCLDLQPTNDLRISIIGASIHYRIAMGPHAGRQALTLSTVPPTPESDNVPLLAKLPGSSLHAASVCEAHQR
jgi:hypothetical protein